MTTISERPSLYSMLLAEGCEIDHYNTDLYVLDTRESREIMALFEGFGGKTNKQRFRSERDNKLWWDLPFHYNPRWIHDIRPTTYAEGRHAALVDIETLSEDCWGGTARDGREIAVRVNETRIEVSVAPEGGTMKDALTGFGGPETGGELYSYEAGELIDRAGGRTMERILDLAGITREKPQLAPTFKLR